MALLDCWGGWICQNAASLSLGYILGCRLPVKTTLSAESAELHGPGWAGAQSPLTCYVERDVQSWWDLWKLQLLKALER